jgi:hypothetical protein
MRAYGLESPVLLNPRAVTLPWWCLARPGLDTTTPTPPRRPVALRPEAERRGRRAIGEVSLSFTRPLLLVLVLPRSPMLTSLPHDGESEAQVPEECHPGAGASVAHLPESRLRNVRELPELP